MKLEVSIGEALDKLSILDIKCRKITDPDRAAHCKHEYNILHAELASIRENYAYEYRVLRWINESIWDLQEQVRSNGKTPNVLERILDENDMRFRVKDRINQLANSEIREQKGYRPRKAFFMGHLGIGDTLVLSGAIRYFAFLYDQVTVVCKARYLNTIKPFFADVPAVQFYLVNEADDICPTRVLDKFRAVTASYDRVILSGCHARSKIPWDGLGDCFYRDMGVPTEVRRIFYRVPSSPVAAEIASGLPEYYRVVHQQTSTRYVSLVKWDIDEFFTIDPNANLYSPGHRWHELAQRFVNRPMVDYIDTMVHADELHLANSSFACMIRDVPIRSHVARCYLRETGEWQQSFTFTHMDEP